MSKPITISLQNLNSLYFKFLNQFVLQHLPKDIYNVVADLLSLKSAGQTYRYLDKLLNSAEEKKAFTFVQEKRTYNSTQDRRIVSSGQEKRENEKRSQSYQEKSNASNQGSASYVDKDDFKYQNQINTIKKPPMLLKRTQTYQSPQQKAPNINYESYNFGQARVNKQDTNNNNNNNNKQVTKSPINNLSATTNINVVKHDFDTVSQKHNSLGHVGSGKRESKESGDMVNNFNTVSDNYSFKGSKGQDSKQKSDQNQSINGYRKTEFSKTYSIRQPQHKIPTSPSMSSTPTNHYQQSSTPTTIINRLQFQNLIRQTKQIFGENAKKISRYQKISTDPTLKQDKPNNDSYTPFNTDGNGSNFTYMYKKY